MPLKTSCAKNDNEIGPGLSDVPPDEDEDEGRDEEHWDVEGAEIETPRNVVLWNECFAAGLRRTGRGVVIGGG